MVRSLLLVAGLLSTTHGRVHELIVGNFANNVLYTLSFDDKTYSLDLIANISVATKNSWISFNHDKTTLYGTDIIYTPAEENWTKPPVYVSHTINNSSSITVDKVLTGKKGCNGTSIYIVADMKPPYNVYGVDFWGAPGCGTVMSVDENGALDKTVQDYNFAPGSNVHGTALSPDSKFIYSADMGNNSIWTHPVDRRTGKLGEPVSRVDGPAEHSEPRHVAVHQQSGKALYTVTEITSQVAWYKLDRRTGIPQPQKNVYSLIPEGLDVKGYRGDEIAVSPSGKYLWATTRSRDVTKPGFLSVFKLDKKGAIVSQNFIRRTSSSGGAANAVTPMDKSDRFVVVTDSADGFVQIWELMEDGSSAHVVAHISLKDKGNARYHSGCCANAVWLTSY
ncbi:Ff.00g006870.m01.CDS01 [Fusarium sp. VM40]|nr:Ff.00g006870.m01.CDS01 [Fusarium sp. VM40]